MMAEVATKVRGWPKRRSHRIAAPPGLPDPRSAPAPCPATESVPVDEELSRIIAEVTKEYESAKHDGCSIRVQISRVGPHLLDSVDAIESKYRRVEPGEEDEVFVGSVRDESKMKGWRKLKNGITMDSGSAVDITPEDENPEFDIVPLSGCRVGRRLGAANGTPIEICGEKWISFSTKEGWHLNWPFIAGKVKKTLKSVGTTCDADNYVLFRKSNGFIVHEVDEAFIEFDRVGNVYVIDVWVKIGSRADLETSGFARQAVVP